MRWLAPVMLVSVALLVTGCGQPGSLTASPSATPAGAEPQPSQPASTAPASPRPTEDPAAPTPSAPETGPATVEGPAAPAEPPPVFPLPYEVPAPTEMTVDDPPIDPATTYEVALVCEHYGSFWLDDGDAAGPEEAGGPFVECTPGELLVVAGVPGTAARLWSYDSSTVAYRRPFGTAFPLEQAAQLIAHAQAAGVRDTVTVGFPCEGSPPGGIVGVGDRTTTCDGAEEVSFPEVPVATALDDLVLPPGYTGIIWMQ